MGAVKQVKHSFLDLIFIALQLALVISHAVLALGKFNAFSLYGTDFALFDQVIWNTLHGRLLENTIISDAPTLLAQRFSPILFAFVPLYALLHDSRILVLTPVVAIGSAAVPLYWLARRRLGRPLALIAVLAFWMMPGLQSIGLNIFKEIVLTIPFLMLAMWFLLAQRYKPFLACLMLALMCKEEVGLIVAGLGIYIFFIQRRYRLGSVVTLFGIAWTAMLIQVVIPYFRGGGTYYYFGSGQYSGSGLYEYLGTSLPEIVTTLVTQPAFVLAHVFTTEKTEILTRMFLPQGIIALAGLENLALALPTLGYTLLSERRGQYIFGSEHYAPVYVFLAIAIVVGMERLLKLANRLTCSQTYLKSVRIAIGGWVLMTSAAAYFLYAPGPLSRNFAPYIFIPSPHDQIGVQIARMIPNDASVVVQSELASHVAQRRYLYLDTIYPCLSGVDYIFADTRRPWYTYREPGWQALFQSPWFTTVVENDGYVLRQRLPALKQDTATNVQFDDRLVFIGYNVPVTRTIIGGEAVHILTGWQVSQPLTRRYTLEYSLYDRAGHLWVQATHEPCRGIRPTNQWKPGQINYDDVLLRLPPTMPSGDYTLTLAMYAHRNEEPLEAHDALGHNLGTEIEIALLPVSKNKQSFTASDLWIEQRYFVDMGEMRLLGFKPFPTTLQAGQPLALGLYWRARVKPQGDYLVVVQVRDASGNLVIEQSDRPALGTYPTTQWEAGEVLLDWHDLQIPSDTPPGKYHLVVALRESSARVLGEAKIGEISVR